MLKLIKNHSQYLTYECSICFRYTEIAKYSVEANRGQVLAPPFCRYCQTDKFNWYYGISNKAPVVEEQNIPFVDTDR